MSGQPPKADIRQKDRHVRFGPQADYQPGWPLSPLLSAIATCLFLKAADGHIAFIHSDNVPALMILSYIEIPMGFKPRLSITDCSERERSSAIRIQRTAPLVF